MSVQRSRVFRRAVFSIQRRFASSDAPYRPWPMEKYFFPLSAQHWSPKHPPKSEEQDEFPPEEVYLDELEARMRKFDRKYRQTEQMKSLHNEFGWDDQDDRAFHTYGGGLSGTEDELQYGRGKKLDPTKYINAEFGAVTRKAVPPVQFMTAEQLRRSRGSMANFREMPPEQPSIWRYWNGYTCLGMFITVMICKEFYVMGGHDMSDGLMMWTFFGLSGSVLADWAAWWNTIMHQEQYDREFFPMTEQVENLHNVLEELAKRPNEKKLMLSLVAYRQTLAEKVLQKTLSNRLNRILDTSLARLQNQVGAEATTRREAESSWKKAGMERTMDYFQQSDVKAQFSKEALKQFTAGDTAKLSTSATTTLMESTLFPDKYQQFHKEAQDVYLKEQNEKGSLSWVFRSEAERKKEMLSAADKKSQYEASIKEWAAKHNPVTVPAPAFA